MATFIGIHPVALPHAISEHVSYINLDRVTIIETRTFANPDGEYEVTVYSLDDDDGYVSHCAETLEELAHLHYKAKSVGSMWPSIRYEMLERVKGKR